MSTPEDGAEDAPRVLGAYGPLSITALPKGAVALDFTGQGQRGPFVTLNGMQWRYLCYAMSSVKRPR